MTVPRPTEAECQATAGWTRAWPLPGCTGRMVGDVVEHPGGIDGRRTCPYHGPVEAAFNARFRPVRLVAA